MRVFSSTSQRIGSRTCRMHEMTSRGDLGHRSVAGSLEIGHPIFAHNAQILGMTKEGTIAPFGRKLKIIIREVGTCRSG